MYAFAFVVVNNLDSDYSSIWSVPTTLLVPIKVHSTLVDIYWTLVLYTLFAQPTRMHKTQSLKNPQKGRILKLYKALIHIHYCKYFGAKIQMRHFDIFTSIFTALLLLQPSENRTTVGLEARGRTCN